MTKNQGYHSSWAKLLIHTVFLFYMNVKRLTFCRWFLNFTHDNQEVMGRIYFSDEPQFDLSVYVNLQIYRIRSAVNPHKYHETSLHPEKIGAWCSTMSCKHRVGGIKKKKSSLLLFMSVPVVY